jgi:hypothetical protein
MTRHRKRRIAAACLLCLLAAAPACAQRGYGRGGGGRVWYSENIRTAREVPQHSYETPTWTHPPGFETDVLTFARIRYDSRGGLNRWDTDLPDSDLNLSYRLQQMTAMRVDPDGRILRITDEDLSQYPFLYIVEPGFLYLSDEEAATLRAYLLNGGFLWLDDFWGEEQWNNMAEQVRKVFPNRRFEEMPMDHSLYNGVYPIQAKTQVPDVDTGTRSEFTSVTWELPDAREVHHRAIFDDQRRLMVFATHNTDNGDGWEWEGHNPFYFREFSEKTAYPLAINVLFYTMTH